MSEQVVVDASAVVDLLAGTDRATAVRAALAGAVLHAPAHFDAEVLSALARLQRVPVTRHDLSPLLLGGWARWDGFRLVDALYVEPADQTGYPLLTTDERLVRGWPGSRGIAGRCVVGQP